MPRCRAASLIDPVLRIASSTAIFPGPMRSPLARSRRMQRRVSVMVPNPTLDEGVFYKFTYGLGTGKSVRLCPFIHNGNKRRRDATAKQNAGTCRRRTARVSGLMQGKSDRMSAFSL